MKKKKKPISISEPDLKSKAVTTENVTNSPVKEVNNIENINETEIKKKYENCL